MRRRTLATLVASATLLVGCGDAVERATANADRSFFGIAPQDEPTAVDFARMGAANVGSYHVVLSWPRVEQVPGRYDWGPYDALFTQLAVNNIVPVTYVYGTAGHVAPTPATPPTISSEAMSGWIAFLKAAAGRYGPDGEFWDRFALTNPGIEPVPIEIWEIWNEENGPAFWAPVPNVKDYAKLLKASARSIRSVEPDAEIMIGGMFATPSSPDAINSSRFLRKLYERKGVTEIADDLAIHPYGPELKDVRRQISRARKVMRKGGERGAGIWITEIGWGSDPATKSQLTKTPAEQARLLGKAYKLLLRKRESWGIRGALWYTWRDPAQPAGLCGWCASAGLVDRDLDPKPAALAFTKLTGGTP